MKPPGSSAAPHGPDPSPASFPSLDMVQPLNVLVGVRGPERPPGLKMPQQGPAQGEVSALVLWDTSLLTQAKCPWPLACLGTPKIMFSHSRPVPLGSFQATKMTKLSRNCCCQTPNLCFYTYYRLMANSFCIKWTMVLQ